MADLFVNNRNSKHFFPDSCEKRMPPRIYFWKIFSVLEPQAYQATVSGILERAQAEGQIPDVITLTPEALEIMKKTDNSRSLTFLRGLISQKKRKPNQGPWVHIQDNQKISSSAPKCAQELR